MKRSQNQSSWSIHYFIVVAAHLQYFLSVDDDEPYRVIPLERAKVLVPAMPRHSLNEISSYPFEILTSGSFESPAECESLYLCARTAVDRDQWIEHLRGIVRENRISEADTSSNVSDSPTKDTRNKEFSSLSQQNKQSSTSSTDSNIEATVIVEPDVIQASQVYRGLETSVVDRLNSAASMLLQSRGSVSNSNDWRLLFERSGLRCYRSRGTSKGVVSIRGDVFFPFSIPEIFKALLDRQLRAQIQPDIDAYPPIKWLSHHTGVEYMRYKPIWPTKPRDYCNLLHWRLLDNGILLFFAISEPSAHYPVDANLIRGHLHVGGYVMESVPGGTQISLTVQVDVGGHIPKALANIVVAERPRLLLNLRDSLEKMYGGKPRSMSKMESPVPPSYEGKSPLCD